MSRKTFDVEEFKNYTNNILAKSIQTPESRMSLMLSLERILHATGTYKGFRYLLQSQVPAGQKPGMCVNETGLIECTPAEEAFDKDKTDNTRVHYF